MPIGSGSMLKAGLLVFRSMAADYSGDGRTQKAPSLAETNSKYAGVIFPASKSIAASQILAKRQAPSRQAPLGQLHCAK